jgi:hypothetical protein
VLLPFRLAAIASVDGWLLPPSSLNEFIAALDEDDVDSGLELVAEEEEDDDDGADDDDDLGA